MQTLDEVIEDDARKMMCSILWHRDQWGLTYDQEDHRHWPWSPAVNDMSTYKRAKDRRAMMRLMLDRGWIEIVDIPNDSEFNHPIRQYRGTEIGRAAVTRPDPLPEIKTEMAVPFPSDPVEERIYGFHLFFYKDHGFWPNGVDRGRVFTGTESRKYSTVWRRRAYQKLCEEGTFVQVRFRGGDKEYSCYIMPRLSPEYADQDGQVFYAKNRKT